MSQYQQDDLAYPHFAIIYIDRYGNLRHETSQSIANSRETILSPWVTDAFLRAVARSKEVVPSHSPFQRGASPSLPRKTPNGHFHVQQSLQHLRRPRSEECSMTSNQKALISIRDNDFLRRYYERVFQNLQQTNCRVLAKAYIKLVEPRKQLSYPYNGRKVVAGETQMLDPGETKPPWWPSEVSHREPDHLLKAERVKLLVHILCELRTSYGISARRLKEADEPIRCQISPPERLQILDELYQVREEEEKFLEGITGTCAVLKQTIALAITTYWPQMARPWWPFLERIYLTQSGSQAVMGKSRHILDGDGHQAVFAPRANPPNSHSTSPSPTQNITQDLPIHHYRNFDPPSASTLQQDPKRKRQDVVTSVPTTSSHYSLGYHSSSFMNSQPFSPESYDELQSLLHQVSTIEQPTTECHGESMGTYTFPYYFN
ncbi:uncharacterized protein N7498_002651 [Penicillium cinerascens]|uniref:Subtelomeric hrmA-associated cluster protein AFUB-079030/YDR124W-like helical bundle domain-containing protein n=1 Tax=Penicillium cinerascens TaxID=70096 RepID=A0A9W9TBF2_9EURO|nr:uncharacterized protein N7498_002651 [Penicillium cinerascens]KAJ5216244.1 hypothetical protein N7498_002651 [Penicillium cinerascens]